jgi:hypothetical protein
VNIDPETWEPCDRCGNLVRRDREKRHACYSDRPCVRGRGFCAPPF